MGAVLTKLFGQRRMRLLLAGLDAAGKADILLSLKHNKTIQTTSTAGFSVETVTHKNIKFSVWDVGGQEKIRPLWRHYYASTQGLIFVVDSADRARIDEAKSELHRILVDNDMRQCVLLVFANKQDIKGAMTTTEVTEKLGLAQLQNRTWYVHPSVAATGEGLREGLQWFSQHIKNTEW